MRSGRKPKPGRQALRNTTLDAQPRCPGHLSQVAQKEWRRLAAPLHAAGILTLADRTALAAYCQAYARWVEAEQRLRETPALLKAPSGYIHQSPWLSIANKQLEIMGRYMAELGLTPTARARLDLPQIGPQSQVDRIEVRIVGVEADGTRYDRPLSGARPLGRVEDAEAPRLIDRDADS